MQRGFIHMWRKLADNPIAKNPFRLSVFIHVLLRAAWKDTTVVMNVGRGTVVVPLKRGQLLIGRNTLSELTGIPPSTVRNHLWGLNKKADRQLDIHPDKHWSIITVINYDTYNPLPVEGGQASGQACGQACGQASDRHLTGFGHKEELKDLGIKDQNQNPSPPAGGVTEKPKGGKGEKPAPSVEVLEIYDEYAKWIRDYPASRQRALKSIATRVKEHGVDPVFETIRPYYDDCIANNREPQFRYVASNFFGRDAHYLNFLRKPEAAT